MVKVCEHIVWIVIDKVHYLCQKREDGYYYKSQKEEYKPVPKKCEIHHGFHMDAALKRICDSIAYNTHKDMDFVLIVTGSGDVRVGKSVLAMQVACYIAFLLDKKFDLEHIFYTAEKLMHNSEKYTKQVFMYDEAREGMNSAMWMANIQKRLLQYFAECGQLNNIYVLVMPCFFELSKRFAVGRTELLLDCYFHKKNTSDSRGNPVTEKCRGYFRIFKKHDKKMLYLKGKDTINYNAWMPSCKPGRFNNIYVVDETGYRGIKKEALNETKRAKEDRKEIRKKKVVQAIEERLKQQFPNLNQKERAFLCGVTPKTLRNWAFEEEMRVKGIVDSSKEGKSDKKEEVVT